MNFTNPHPDQRWCSAVGRMVQPGESIEVDDATGAALVADGWTVAKPPKPPASKED